MPARRFSAYRPPARLKMFHERRERERARGVLPPPDDARLTGALRRWLGVRGDL